MTRCVFNLRSVRWRADFLVAITCVLVSAGWARESCAGATFHVAITGNDDADGSAQRPFQSLAKATARARALRAMQPHEQVTIELAAGAYVLADPLVLTPEDSGESAQQPLEIVGRGDVQISGGTRIDGFQQRGTHWIASVPKSVPAFRDLWVNGCRARRARSPNEGFFRVASAGPDKRTSFFVEPNNLLALANPTTAEVVYLHDWSVSRVGLKAIDSPRLAYQLAAPIGAHLPFFAICGFEQHPRYFVENAIELLDAPGEWFFDSAKRELHYIPQAGEVIDKTEVVAPRLTELIVARGTDRRPVDNLRIRGVTFTNTTFQLPALGYAEVQANWYGRRNDLTDRSSVLPTAAMTIDRARNCVIENCRFEHLAAHGLHISNSVNVHIHDSLFSDLGGNGIMIGIPLNEGKPSADRNLIENCTIESCAQTFFGGVGIWVGMASNTIVRNNEVRALPYTGISVGWSWKPVATLCRGNQIEFNHIHHVMQLLSDGGGIYTLGWQPGTRLTGNVIHDVPVNSGRAESNGIFVDEGSTDLQVKDNLIYRVVRSPIRFNVAGKNTIARNRLVLTPGTPAFRYTATNASDMNFVDNTVIENAAWEPPADDDAMKRAGPQR